MRSLFQKLLIVQTCSVVIHWLNSISLMKTQAIFEIRAYIKSRVNLNSLCSQTYYEFCQIHRTSAVSKTLVYRWHKKFQDGFINLKDGSGSTMRPDITGRIVNRASEYDQEIP